LGSGILVRKGVTMTLVTANSQNLLGRIDYPDQDVLQRVRTFLNSRHFPAFRQLQVDVVNGAVRLSGSVRTYYEKQVALNSCQRVAGVLQLIDDIGVGIAPPK
jgi:osmotically-inducible protein OsmY